MEGHLSGRGVSSWRRWRPRLACASGCDCSVGVLKPLVVVVVVVDGVVQLYLRLSFEGRVLLS